VAHISPLDPVLSLSADFWFLTEVELKNFMRIQYDMNETACRIAVDYVLIACKVRLAQIQQNSGFPNIEHMALDDKAARPTTPLRKTYADLLVFPEMNLAVTVRHAATSTRYSVCGRADWAIGYDSRKNCQDGSVLVAVEAKKPSKLGEARAQLLTYLAILRQLRLQEGKRNCTVQGFYSDGNQYRFMMIDHQGFINESVNYDVRREEDVTIVFNWILAILVTAAKSSPSSSPTKPGAQQDKEIDDNAAFVEVYKFDPGEFWDDIDIDDPDYTCEDVSWLLPNPF
jgi:hypothetical protein